MLALIVDHGLRVESAAEAAATAATLGALGIPARILSLGPIASGSGIPERARIARLSALEAACRGAGIIDLLLGHQAADQAETVIMRQLRGSGPAGLSGMAAISETSTIRLLRPLLTVAPGRLRAVLLARGLGWVEDATNADGRFTRARLRAARADTAGSGPATRALVAAATADGQARGRADNRLAEWLAANVALRPEGFALLPEGVWPPRALAALVRMVTGAAYLPSPDAVSAIAATPEQAIGGGICLGGARLVPAGRLGSGFLVCREAAAMADPVPAEAGAGWDDRFRRPANQRALPGETIGALGPSSHRFRNMSDLPAVVLETLPAYRNVHGEVVALPALAWPDGPGVFERQLLFHPRRPARGAAFGALSCLVGKAVMSEAAAGHEDGDALLQKTSYL